jgi:hypothetical protein
MKPSHLRCRIDYPVSIEAKLHSRSLNRRLAGALRNISGKKVEYGRQDGRT